VKIKKKGCPNPPVLGENPHLGGGGMAWVAILAAPPPSLPLSPYLNDICPFFLLLFVPLDAALLFDVNASCSLMRIRIQHTDLNNEWFTFFFRQGVCGLYVESGSITVPVYNVFFPFRREVRAEPSQAGCGFYSAFNQ
jgi:hypothetical protein